MTFGQASASTQMLAVAKLASPLDMVMDATIYAPARLCWRVPQKPKRHPSEGRRLAASVCYREIGRSLLDVRFWPVALLGVLFVPLRPRPLIEHRIRCRDLADL